MSADENDFVGRVVGATSQGAVGAVVAAALSAVTEPVVNQVLVNRVPVAQAVRELDPTKIYSFLKTTLATNFIKFPFFETTNVILAGVDIPPAARGVAIGAVFCTTTLPITNYRFRKSMGMPIRAADLYQAYLPTVLRDILYGVVRNKVMPAMIERNPQGAATSMRRFVNMFVTVLAACVLSAPGNELRGYFLQPSEKSLPFKDFFKPDKFVRSTTIGGLIMAISLGVGALVTPQVEKLRGALREYFRQQPLGYLLVFLFVFHHALEQRHHRPPVEDCGEDQARGSAAKV